MSAIVKVSNELLNAMAETNQATEEQAHLKFDLGNMAIFSTSDVEFKRARDIQYLNTTARDHVQQLYAKIFSLPTETAGDESGRLAVLPEPSTLLPREKPAPKGPVLTKWEVFAKTKGITKRKREGRVWDEEKEQWMHRHGYKRANDEMNQWAIDHKEGSDPTIDPWTEMKQAKKQRVDKNKKQQEANIRAATTGSRTAVPGALDLASVLGKSRPGKRNALGKDKKGVSHLDVALGVAQKSTNSMGKFDKLRKGEAPIAPLKKVRRDGELQKIANEKKQHSEVLKKVLGRVTETEAFSVDRAISSIGASDFKSGEVVSAKKVMDRRAAASKGKGGKKTEKGRSKSKGGPSKGGKSGPSKGGKGGARKGGKK